MDLDLGDEVVFKVKVGPNTYILREPTTDEIELVAAADEKDIKAVNQSMKRFIVGLGMPEKVFSSLGMRRTTKLIKGLTGAFTEKK